MTLLRSLAEVDSNLCISGKTDRTRSRSDSMLLLILLDMMLKVFPARMRRARLRFHMLIDMCAMAVVT